MLRTSITQLTSILLLGLVAVADGQIPSAAPPTVVNTRPIRPELPEFITRQTTFTIPFTVDRNVAQPVEVHLYVSRDNGVSWRLCARQQPGAREFTFRATEDGDYWFASRTLDASNRIRAQQQLQPELRIVVDTTQPQFEFTARPGQGGGVLTSWQVSDPSLDISSLKLEYQDGVGQAWKPIAIRIPPDVHDQWRGQNTWWPETQLATVNIRAEVRDRAGNRAIVSRRLLLPSVAAEQPRYSGDSGAPLSPDQLAGRAMPSGGAVPWLSDNRPELNRGTRYQPASGPGMPPGAPGPNLTTAWTPSSPAPMGDRPRASVPGVSDAPLAGIPPTVAALQSQAQPVAADSQQHAQLPMLHRRAESSQPVGVAPTETVPEMPWDSQPSIPSTARPQQSQGPIIAPVSSGRTAPAVTPSRPLPSGEQPQMTNSRHFQLDYDVDAVGHSGIAEVQLWATEDAGQTWRLWGTDSDLHSPFNVEVERERVFGFRVVIIARNGLSGSRPQSGDPPDIWVGVDTTHPQARLTGALYGEGQRAGQLIIRWQASDENLGRRPIALSFSQSPEGPWTVIASALPNNGEYAWAADPQLPPRVFVRLEVRDSAGNVALDQTNQAIRIDGLAPKARIRGIMPLHDMDREAFRRPRRR